MGKVKAHHMDQIESDFEHRSLVDPRFGLEPTIDEEIKEFAFKASCFNEQVQDLFKDDYTILDKIDTLEYLKEYDLNTLACRLLSIIKANWEMQEEAMREEEEEARREYEAMQDVYAEVRASFL